MEEWVESYRVEEAALDLMIIEETQARGENGQLGKGMVQ